MTEGRPVLLVCLKFPEPGKVKTRLAADIGAETAAHIYRRMLDKVLGSVQPVRGAMRVVGYFDGAPAGQFAEWANFVDDWHPQPAGGLGERLAAGFAWGHARGAPVIAIGTDCPDVRAEHLHAAVETLRTADVVFGPATDGGYYLVGTRRPVTGFFDGVRWSSPHTLVDHQNRCRQLGMSVALVPELADIDTAADWATYQARGQGR